MAILGTPIIDIWCERKLNEDGTHSAILNWNPKYAKVFIYRKKDGNSWEQTPIIVTNSNTYEDIIDSQNKEYDYYYCASYNNGLIDITQYDCCCQSDIAPPGEVTDFSVSNSDKKITIKWTDPDDEDWDHTILVRKLIMNDTTVEPENENDGVQIVTIYNEKVKTILEDEEEKIKENPLLTSFKIISKNKSTYYDEEGNPQVVESEIVNDNYFEYEEDNTNIPEDSVGNDSPPEDNNNPGEIDKPENKPNENKVPSYITVVLREKNKYSEKGYDDKTCSLHKKYYYKCFTVDKMGNVCKTCKSAISFLLDKTPPRNAEFINTSTNSEVIDISDYIYLEWQNPTNDDFAGTILTRKRVDIGTGEPLTYTDGDIIYTNEKNVNNSYYYDYDVEENVEYYYKLFPYDESMNFNNNCSYCIKSMSNSYKITNFKVFPINESKYNLLLDEIYENVDCKQYDEFGNLIGVEKKYINIKADLRGEVHVAQGPDYAVREDNEINGFLSGVKLTFNDCNLDYDKLFIVRNESSYSTNFEEDTAKESPTNKIVYCSDYNYYYYGSFNELLADNYQDYIVNKYFSITDNNITVYDTDEFIYNNFYYFGKNSRNLLTDKFENNKTYYYTAYITVNGEDSGGNKITTVYRQKLNAIKKIKFSDNSLTSNKANILKTFKNYFSLYDENYWSVDHSISSSDLIMPCYYSSSENGALIYNERVESSLEDNLNNIEYISINVEFGGWLNYGYFNKDSYFSLDQSFIQFYDQIYNKLYDKTYGYNMFKTSSKQILIQNKNIKDNYIPMVKINKYNRMLIDSIVLAYNSQPSTMFSIIITDLILRNNIVEEDRKFILPIVDGYEYNCVVDWGDGTKTSIVGTLVELDINTLIHEYPKAGTYFISIDGYCPTLKFGIGTSEEIVGQEDFIDTDPDSPGTDVDPDNPDVDPDSPDVDPDSPDPDPTSNYTEIEKLIISTNTREKLSNISSLDGIIIGTECMFKGCTNLHFSGDLKIPDTILNCNDMFNGCESLSETPKLPSNLVTAVNMFKNCYSLIKTCDVLPISLKYSDAMYSGCNNLVSAPLIPKTGNIESCTYMFDSCVNMRSTPNNWDGYADVVKLDDDGNPVMNGDVEVKIPNPISNNAKFCYKDCVSIAYIDGVPGNLSSIPNNWK